MRAFRLLLFLALIPLQSMTGQSNHAGPDAEKAKPEAAPAPAEPSITFNLVHVDGPYIAMTFDDGPNATLTMIFPASRGSPAVRRLATSQRLTL